MRVKSIVLDGFKSYAHRRELDQLSPHFNAITGLNGSGKSNIFDAICFVMGITNLKRMRADDPRELIYRAGTTGVHAARVTIEFINDDPETAPPGYSCEEYPIITVGRQIKMGGKQQFFLNNTVSMQSRVKRFFESISLNVDNPHFMVLQGTVHKLIGMRSTDMLSLIEEAVGTKAFDHRRRTAEMLMKNKDKKIQEIDDNIQTQIGPMLEAMKADQEAYRRYLVLTEGLEEKRRFRAAFEYYKRVQHQQSLQSSVEQSRESVAQAKAQLQGFPAQEDQLTRRLLSLQEGLGGPCHEAVELHELEDSQKKNKSRVESLVTTTTKRLSQLQKVEAELKKEEVRLQKGAEAFRLEKDKREALTTAIKVKKDEMHHLQQSLQLLKSGVRAGTSGMSLEEERHQLDVKTIQLQAAIKRHEEALRDVAQEVESLEARRTKHSSSLLELQEELKAASTAFEAAERVYQQRVAPLQEQLSQKQDRVRECRRNVERAHEQFQRENGGRASFELSFDRKACRVSGPPGDSIDNHILGRVGELVVPVEDKYARALVVGAHHQLLRVVVDHDSVAEEIIHNGLRQRTSFLPLNKIQINQHQEQTMRRRVEEAKRLAAKAGGFAYLAKDLVRVSPTSSSSLSSNSTSTSNNNSGGVVKNEKGGRGGNDQAGGAQEEVLRVLADFVFGQFIVCSSLAVAEELAYNQAVRLKAVTLDGEVAEPNGIMTGGSTANIRDLFAELRAFSNRKAPLLQAQCELHEEEEAQRRLQEQLRREDAVLQAYRSAEEKYEVLNQRWQRADGGGSAEKQIAGLRAKQEEHQKQLNEAQERLQEVVQRRTEMEAEAKVDAPAAEKELKKKLSKAETELTKLVKEEESSLAAFERANAEAEERAATLRQRQRENEEEQQQASHDLEQVKAELAEVEAALQKTLERIQQVETTRRLMEKEVEEVQEDLSRHKEQQHSLEGIIRNGEAEKNQMQRQIEEEARKIREDLRHHPWMEAAQEQFGDVNGPFYFNDTARTEKTLRELAEAEAHTVVVSRKINKKSSAVLYEDRKREYEELVQQREALGEDKIAIQECIRGIEQRKWHALDRMVGIVSSVFGKLFETCLPGASAALMEERDSVGHLCGLGVQVIFNGKKKESLSELSGGQRSLLALCLILAILRVRQAPIYILDEVDAALDPSHTQNIGLMLHTYFPTSQFLLVSLKDGMFSNADVLYHVRNTQGYSEVTRVAQQGGGGRAP